MVDVEGRIIENRNVASNYYLLRLRLTKPMGKVTPGQFVMIRIPGNEVFLRRPFSIYDYSKGVLTIVYKLVGKGTGCLSKATKGETALVLGPLGNGFRVKPRDEYLIVSGGIGFAGIHLLVKQLKERASIFFGCSNSVEMALLADVKQYNPMVSTLDCSYGFEGTVVEMLREHFVSARTSDREIFVCGPEGMLKSLRDLLEKDRTPCQVLVEERMACGLGLCFGCVRKMLDLNEPYKRVCREGPVFDLWEISL
jgi:dihydroorotate dehydrogenase electron transfer subunit